VGRTAWHVGFAIFVKETAPPDTEVRFEVVLTTEPQRGDLLLLRRGELRSGAAKALRGLWPLLRGDTILEYKSFAWPLRAGDLARLQGYGAQYYAAEIGQRAFDLGELSLVLVVAKRTPTLTEELERMGWTMTEISPGYARITGSGYAMYLVVLAEVAKAEQDEIVALFSGPRWTPEQLDWWWRHHAGSMEGVNVQQTEDYDKIMREIAEHMTVEQRLAGLAPEQRLAGLAPEQMLRAYEQRLAGLDRDHQALALPAELLRALSEEYIRSLPVEVQEEIRRRIRRRGA
jgi:hypothetical protein